MDGRLGRNYPICRAARWRGALLTPFARADGKMFSCHFACYSLSSKHDTLDLVPANASLDAPNGTPFAQASVISRLERGQALSGWSALADSSKRSVRLEIGEADWGVEGAPRNPRDVASKTSVSGALNVKQKPRRIQRT